LSEAASNTFGAVLLLYGQHVVYARQRYATSLSPHCCCCLLLLLLPAAAAAPLLLLLPARRASA
jgi:hypothetical protein